MRARCPIAVAGFYLYDDHNQVIAALATRLRISESAAFRHLLALGMQQPMPFELPREADRRSACGGTRNFAVASSSAQELRCYAEQLKQRTGSSHLPRARVVRYLIEAGYHTLQTTDTPRGEEVQLIPAASMP